MIFDIYTFNQLFSYWTSKWPFRRNFLLLFFTRANAIVYIFILIIDFSNFFGYYYFSSWYDRSTLFSQFSVYCNDPNMCIYWINFYIWLWTLLTHSTSHMIDKPNIHLLAVIFVFFCFEMHNIKANQRWRWRLWQFLHKTLQSRTTNLM